MWSYRHNHFTVHQLPALRDNYIYLIEADKPEALIAVDPADASVVKHACTRLGKPLTHIFNTHHHWDHTDGNKALKNNFDCRIVGATGDSDRIPGIDTPVSESSPPAITGLNISVLEVPGHTRGHIAFLIDDALFCGDTLFGAGCGRLFEGTAEQMWDSLQKIAALPDETKIYCAHEYTLSNLRFAGDIEPKNRALSERMRHDTKTRDRNRPTIPSNLGLEKATNPFLRPLDSIFCRAYAKQHGTATAAAAVFRSIREWKDRW